MNMGAMGSTGSSAKVPSIAGSKTLSMGSKVKKMLAMQSPPWKKRKSFGKAMGSMMPKKAR